MIFEVKNLCYGYTRNDFILNDITFSVKSGEIVSILGANGVGKTTLLKCILGFVKRNSGEIVLDGERIKNFSRNFWKRVSYVSQIKRQGFAFSALDMVILGRNVHIQGLKQPSKTDYDIAVKTLGKLRIDNLKDRPLTELSMGELQMVLIARALVSEPEIIVLDEPESSLDMKNQIVIISLLKELAEKERLCVIFNTHYPDNAFKIADKTLLLNRDKSFIFGETCDVINSENIYRAFGVHVEVSDNIIDGKIYRNVISVF